LCARAANPARSRGRSASPLERMAVDAPALTLADKLSLAGLDVFIGLWLIGGAVFAIYIQAIYRGGEVATHSGQWSQIVLYLFGVLGGAAVGLLLTRLLSHCFASVATQRRWLGALQEALENP